jgi:hypothetical protein
MTTFIHKPGTGCLFKNDNKTKELQPDFTGKIIISNDCKEGDEIKLSGWIKQSSKGNFLSLSINTYQPENKDTFLRSNNNE